MRDLHYWRTRVLNGLRKVGHGLRPFNESVWPGVRNDLFVAHESLYHFATRFARDADVLDVGCGTGYGSAMLSAGGARSVVGIDVDRSSIRYAARHYGRPSLTFRVADGEKVAFPAGSLDLAFSSNVLEHLNDPSACLRAIATALRPGGVAVIAIPPITTADAHEENAGIHFHRSNFELSEWATLLSQFPWSVAFHLHRFTGAGPSPDFTSPFQTRLSVDDFCCTEGTIEEAYRQCPITAVFVAQREP